MEEEEEEEQEGVKTRLAPGRCVCPGLWVTQLAFGRGCQSGSCRGGSGASASGSQSRWTGPGEGSGPAPSLHPDAPSSRGGLGAGAMAGLGDGEHSMSVLERLLANAALRDEAGRLRGPELRAPPAEGVSRDRGCGVQGALGWLFSHGRGCPSCLLQR